MTDRSSFISVTHAMSGFFAVMYSWSDDAEVGGYFEPWTTGFGRYETGDAANAEARTWAEAEGCRYEPHHVGATFESVAAAEAARSARMKGQIARIHELKAGGMSGPDAIRQARQEFPVAA